MMRKILGCLCLLLFAASASGTQISVRLASVLKGEVMEMARNGRALTVALKITNESKDAHAFILLFGVPSAFDNAGGRWPNILGVAGVAYCPGPQTYPPSFRLCVGIPRVDDQYLFPMQGYTDIPPGESATVHYQFTAGGEKGDRVALTHDLAYRFATAEKDAAMTDAEKLKAVRFGSLSFDFTEQEVVNSTIRYDTVHPVK
jgi:hypothetical protein